MRKKQSLRSETWTHSLILLQDNIKPLAVHWRKKAGFSICPKSLPNSAFILSFYDLKLS